MTALPTPSTHHQPVPEGRAGSLRVVGLEGTPVACDVVEVGQTTGIPVIFLHGLVGLNDHWEDLVKRIQHRSRCILVQVPLLDLTGEDCSIQGATELTIRFLEQHVREPSVLVGNSFGGHVAARIAIQRPDLTRGLVLAGASGVIEKSIVADVQIRPSREWLERKIGELFFDPARNMNPQDVDRAHKELSDKAHARAMVRLSRTARRNHLGPDLGRITAPTLLVWGKQDIVTPPEACETFARSIRGARVLWIDNCGHVPMIEGVDLFAHAMHQFLDDLERRPAR